MKVYICFLNVNTVDTSYCIFDKVIGVFDSLDKAKKEIKSLDINKYLRPELDSVLVLKDDFIQVNNKWTVEYKEKENTGLCSDGSISIQEVELNKFSN